MSSTVYKVVIYAYISHKNLQVRKIIPNYITQDKEDEDEVFNNLDIYNNRSEYNRIYMSSSGYIVSKTLEETQNELDFKSNLHDIKQAIKTFAKIWGVNKDTVIFRCYDWYNGVDDPIYMEK